MSTSDPLVDEIVSQVLGQLRGAAGPARAPATGIDNRQSPGGPSVNTTAGAVINDKVITAEVLETVCAGVTHVRLSPDAVLTPSARDYLRERGIGYNRSASAAAAASNGTTWTAVVLGANEAVERALDEASRSSAARWTTQTADGPPAAARAAIASITTEGRAGTVIVGAPAAALACRVNRHAKVRAAVVESGRCVQRAKSEMAPNVFCIDPGGKSFFEIRNMLREIAAGPRGSAPEWMQ